MSTDAIVLLEKDHQEIKRAFDAFEKAGEKAQARKAQVREGLGRKRLQEIGAEVLEARKSAPRRPSQPSALKKTIDAVIT